MTQGTHGESGDLTKRWTLPSEYGGGENMRGNAGKYRKPMSDDLTYTVQIKLRLPAECDGDRRQVEAGGG